MATATLDQRVANLVSGGYAIKQQTSTSATLVKPKRFGMGWAIFWFLFAGIGVLLYFAYHLWAKKTEQVYLTIDGSGQISETRSQVA